MRVNDESIKDYLSKNIADLASVTADTINERSKEMYTLFKFHRALRIFDIAFNDAQIKQWMESKRKGISNPEEISDMKERMFWNDMIIYIGIDFEQEYPGFLADMLVGSYKSAIRSMRWFLESIVKISEYQTREGRVKAEELLLFDRKGREHYPSFAKFRSIIEFYERLRQTQDSGRPTMGDLLRNLRKRQITIGGESGRITKLWRELSQYSHITLKTTGDLSKMAHVGNAFLEHNFFSAKDFDESFRYSIQVLDIVLSLGIKTQTFYYGFENPDEYVVNMISDKQKINAKSFYSSLEQCSNVKIYELMPFTHKLSKTLSM